MLLSILQNDECSIQMQVSLVLRHLQLVHHLKEGLMQQSPLIFLCVQVLIELNQALRFQAIFEPNRQGLLLKKMRSFMDKNSHLSQTTIA